MDLFESSAAKIRRRFRMLLPALFLAVLCLIFCTGISLASGESLAKEQASLERALYRGAVHTYALSGRYPESAGVLLEDYGITYDREKFVVEYIPNGSNLLPLISVIPLGNGKGGSS